MQKNPDFQGPWMPARPLLVHQWDGEELVLVFHPPSGDTHLLDALSAEVLRLLAAQPQTAQELWQQLLQESGLTGEDFGLDRLQPILSRLEQLDLIERVSA